MAIAIIKGLSLNYTLVSEENVDEALGNLHPDELHILKKHRKEFTLHLGNGVMRTDGRCGEVWVRDNEINVRLYIGKGCVIDPGTVIHELTHVHQWQRGEDLSQKQYSIGGGGYGYFTSPLEKEAFRNEYLWKKKRGMVSLPYWLWYRMMATQYKVYDLVHSRK